jgi:hypothetical protein
MNSTDPNIESRQRKFALLDQHPPGEIWTELVFWRNHQDRTIEHTATGTIITARHPKCRQLFTMERNGSTFTAITPFSECGNGHDCLDGHCSICNSKSANVARFAALHKKQKSVS